MASIVDWIVVKNKRFLASLSCGRTIWLAALVISLAFAPSTFADSVVPVTASAGSDFFIDFDGFINSGATIITGLTGRAEFNNFTFTAGTGAHAGQTLVTFNVNLTDNSSLPITGSRISLLGFDTTPNIATTGDSVTGTFDTVNAGNLPNVGKVEFCLTDVNCAGGGNGGVTQGNTGSMHASLYFSGANLSSITFDDIYDRYQAITGSCDNCGGSASGASVAIVPEPAQVPVLLVLGTGMFLFVRRRLAPRNA